LLDEQGIGQLEHTVHVALDLDVAADIRLCHVQLGRRPKERPQRARVGEHERAAFVRRGRPKPAPVPEPDAEIRRRPEHIGQECERGFGWIRQTSPPG
jgi:hypothetical protein